MQWLCAGAMFALFAAHERLGSAADIFMQDGSRQGTALWSTGLWPFLIGVPVIATLTIAVRGTRHIFLKRAPSALVLLIAGFIVMFTGHRSSSSPRICSTRALRTAAGT